MKEHCVALSAIGMAAHAPVQHSDSKSSKLVLIQAATSLLCTKGTQPTKCNANFPPDWWGNAEKGKIDQFGSGKKKKTASSEMTGKASRQMLNFNV